MKLPPDQLSVILRTAMEVARAIRAQGSDVPPCLLLFNRTPQGEIGAMDIAPLHHATKDQQAAAHQGYARLPDVLACVLVHEGWRGSPASDLTPSEQPEREEVLMLNILTATDQWLAVAPISGTTIHPYTLHEMGGDMTMEGRFARPAS